MYRTTVSMVVALAFALTAACASTSSRPAPDKERMAEAHYKLGLAHLSEGNLQPAFLEFQKTIRLNPQDKEAWNLLGYIYTRLEQYQNGEDAFHQALSIDPSYSEARNNLGVLYNHQERWEEAIAEFRRALENPLYETPQKALNNMGFAYMKRGNLTEARNAFDQALRRGTIPQAHYNLALVMIDLGQGDEAIAELKEALTESPGYLEAHWLLAQQYIDRNQAQAAIPHLEMVAAQMPNDERGKTARRYLNLLDQRVPQGATGSRADNPNRFKGAGQGGRLTP